MTMVFQWWRSRWNLIHEQPSFYSIILSFQLRLQCWVLGIYKFLTSVFGEVHQAVKTGWIFISLNGKSEVGHRALLEGFKTIEKTLKKKTTFLAKQSGHKHLESNAHATRRNIPCSKPTNPITYSNPQEFSGMWSKYAILQPTSIIPTPFLTE
jgi:hypothetical protein